MIMKKSIVLLLITLAILISGCQANLAQDGSPVVAEVNGEIISKKEFKAAKHSSIVNGYHLSDDEILDNLINTILLVQEGKRIGITIDEQSLEETLEQSKKIDVNSLPEQQKQIFNDFLDDIDLTYEEYIDTIFSKSLRNGMIMHKVYIEIQNETEKNIVSLPFEEQVKARDNALNNKIAELRKSAKIKKYKSNI